MIDKDFELQGEAAERPQPKKLTAADIPEGYGWAAVDKNGDAYAFFEKPTALRCVWVVNEFVEQNAFFIGENFDSSDWQESLVARETSEQPELKKLTAADIPQGYNYAAVDANGQTYAYVLKPELQKSGWCCLACNYKLISSQYDASDWQNSLVSRETAEKNNIPLLSVSEFAQLVQEIQKNKKDANESEALKDQENKPSFLEIDPNFLEAMAWRMTSNKGKYPPNNWQRPHELLLDVDAIYRHLNDIKRQLEGNKSLTGESIQKHCAAIACNAMFLFYHAQEDQWQRAARSRQSNAKEI